MTHSSGIRHYDPGENGSRVRPESIADAVEIFKYDPLLFEPGTQTHLAHAERFAATARTSALLPPETGANGQGTPGQRAASGAALPCPRMRCSPPSWRDPMRTLITAGLLLLACAQAQPAAAQAKSSGDPMVGTWNLNVARSTFAGAPPKAGSYRYENLPDGSTLWVASSIGPTGNPGFSISIRRYDGRDYPAYNVATMTPFLATNARTNWTQASRMIDANTTELLNKTDGVVTSRVTRTLARDGRTFTLRSYSPTGELQSTSIYEKVDQPPTS